MAIALLIGRDQKQQEELKWFAAEVKNALLALQPDLDIRVWPDIGKHEDITFALVWHHPWGVLRKFPQLKAISSLGAGVDHVFKDPELPDEIPITRIKDPYMAKDILQYVVACLLSYLKRLDHWQEKQRQQTWFKQPPFNLADQTIGMMGLGFLGSQTAELIHNLGLPIIGWSKTPKHLPGIKTYAGPNQFHEFLSQTNVLICMLPLTPETKHILNWQTFSRLPTSSYLINVGRGEHLVEDDLLQALASGQLSGAALDVFSLEPLPSEHPFWKHPNIRVTPHIASVTNAKTVAPQILHNYQRSLANQELLNIIDKTKGY